MILLLGNLELFIDLSLVPVTGWKKVNHERHNKSVKLFFHTGLLVQYSLIPQTELKTSLYLKEREIWREENEIPGQY